MSENEVEFLVVGAGLSGLTATHCLQSLGKNVLLTEARDRIGGRALTVPESSSGAHTIDCDLGPSWVWPDQTELLRLVSEMSLKVYPQYDVGGVVYQQPNGDVTTASGTTPMAGALRIQGGAQSLAHRLADKIVPSCVHLNCTATSVTLNEDSISVTCDTESGSRVIQSQNLVIAMPPRLAADITFAPALPADTQAKLASTPTWMAGHAKFFAVYESPFWRERNLCGSAFSRRGPLTEIHDASPQAGNVGSLFGFLGLDPKTRVNWGKDRIIEESINQLSRMFGDAAGKPIETHYLDWSLEQFTAADTDRVPQLRHPQYGLQLDVGNAWENKLSFIASETSFASGGLIDGALQAALNFSRKIAGEHDKEPESGSHFASMGWDWL